MEQYKFDLSEIQDVRIIIKAKGKHWSIVPKKGARKEAEIYRKAALIGCLKVHDIIDTPLEEIRDKKLLNQ